MEQDGTIRIGEAKIKSTNPEIKLLKAILDKLELPHILDDVSFHNTLLDLNRIKIIHNTDVWKVERDGSICLTNRFGHSGRFAFRHLELMSLLEFQFVNLGILNTNEMRFLDDLLYKVECETEALMPRKRQIDKL
jgi:hypothetical protein